MSETIDTNTTKPQGKGLAVSGFVIALVGLIFGSIVYAGITIAAVAAASKGEEAGMGLGYFWILLCAGSVALSAMGMVKLGKTGGKKGLAIAGLVIGIVALVWTIMMHIGVGAAVSEANANSANIQDALQEIQNAQ
jgi:hypothetical protein